MTVAPPASSCPTMPAAIEPWLAPVTTAVSPAHGAFGSVRASAAILLEALLEARVAVGGVPLGLRRERLAGADEADVEVVAVDDAREVLARTGPTVVEQYGLVLVERRSGELGPVAAELGLDAREDRGVVCVRLDDRRLAR